MTKSDSQQQKTISSQNSIEIKEKPYKISKKEKEEIEMWKSTVPRFIIQYKEKMFGKS